MILAHLAKPDYERSEDTFERIAQWWLLEQEIKFQEAQVKKAHDEFVADNLVIKKKRKDRKIFYRVNRGRLEEIRKLVKSMSR